MSLDGMEAVVCVKQECDSDGCGDNEAALAALYEGHVVKQELVLGPELLQKPSDVYTPPASVTTPLEAACVKWEQGWGSDGHSETEDELNEELVDEDLELGPAVLKEELELGPVVLQPPDALYSLRASITTPLEAARVKPEQGWDSDGHSESEDELNEELVDGDLELGPAVLKEELELGPAVLQPPDAVYSLRASVTTPLEAARVKPEQGWDSDGHSETEDELNEELVDEDLELGPAVLKEELELGPVVLQPPDAVYSLRASLKTEDKTSLAQTQLDGSCSVVLERVLVDMEARICTIGPQKHTFRLCEQKQDVQTEAKVNPRKNKITKKTKSAKTRQPKAPVDEKKAKPSEEIAKHNSAEMIQEPSAASQDDLPWNIVVQEATPDKPAGSSSSSEVNTLPAETYFKCEKCGKGFNIKSDLEKHINTHMLMEASTSRKASKFTCMTCNCTFDTKLLLQEHEKSRHGVKYFACNECEYATKHASHLSAHLRTHTGEKPFKCSRCSSAYSKSSHFQRHLRTHTGEKAYKCSQCSSAFTQSSDLQRHLRTHTGEKPFKCSQCSLAFTANYHLQRHLRTHTGEKAYKCSQCSSTFTQSSHLQRHRRTHTGEKPFKCSQCSFAFTANGDLQRHLRTHTGEKPFKCSQCSFAFTANGDLQRHLRTHTGEKPFECNICDYKTTQSGTLKDHLMSRHSGQKPFGCDACSYRAATRGNLRKHMKKLHKSA